MNTLYFSRSFWGVLLLGLALPTLAAPTPTLRDILLRHQRASGTAESRADKSAHEIVYNIDAGGLQGTLTTYEASGHRSRSEIRLGPLAITTATDGKTSWEQDGDGHVRILNGEELAENKADAGFSLDSVDPFKKGSAGQMTLRPKQDPATGDYVLDVQPTGGTLQTIFLDPKTYLIQKSIVRKGGLVSTISILAYRTQFGQPLPSHMQIQPSGLPLMIDATLQQATRLPTVTASLFAPPAAPKDWEFLTPSATSSVSFPFETDDNEVIMAVTVNGHPLRLLLDSGAGGAFVTAQAAETAGLTTQGNLPALGYGGASFTGLATEATVEIGGSVRLSGLTLHVIKDPNIAKLLSERGQVDGAIGFELLTRFVTQIDYATKTVTLFDPSHSPLVPDNRAVTLPLKLETRMPTVLASVDGHAPARFLVDTGDAGSVHLYTQYAEANGLLPKPNDPHAQRSIGVGVGGTVQEISTPGHTLHLGKAEVAGLDLATMTGPGITRLSSHAGGIGNLALRHFIVTFDYPRSQMRLLPAAPLSTAAAFPTFRSRFRFAADIVPVPVTAPMTLETLLQRHLEALGGADAITALKNTKVVSSVQTGGITGTITTVYAAPDREYEEDKLGIMDIQQGYDGKTAWQRDTNGNVRPLAGEELKDLRVQLFFDTNSYVLPGRIPGKLTLRPLAEPSTGNYIVDALPEGGKPSTLYFDPQTFFIVKEQHLDDNVLVTTNYGDYRTVDRARFPFRMATTNGTTRYDIVGTVTEVENNIALPTDLFEPPHIGSKFRFVKPGMTRATVPFDMDDGEIGLTVRLNGQPARVFLDTGASGIALSQATATKLGLKSSGFLEARGYGGSTDLHPILLNRFEVPGAVQLTDVTAIAIDLPDTLNSFFQHPLAGFVGYDLLAHFVVRVDFPHKQITFIQPDTFHPTPEDGKALSLELDNDVPSIEAKLENLPTQRFLLDTGDEAALRLYSPFVTQYGLDKKYPHGVLSSGGGIGGVSESRISRTGSFQVAGITLRGIPTDFSLDTKGGASLVNAGSLGATLLAHFVVTFDYPHSRVFFASTPKTHAPFVTRTTGLTLTETKDPHGRAHLVVAEINPRSPAINSGLNTFDEVLAIDGRRASELGLTGARHLLSPASNRQSHLLLVQSTIGKPRTVKVPLFDPLP